MSKFLGGVMVLMALVLAVAPVFYRLPIAGQAADNRRWEKRVHEVPLAGVAEVAAAVPLGLAGIYALRNRAGRRRASPVLSAWLQA